MKREASEKKEEMRRQSEELRGLEKALEACASERVRVETERCEEGEVGEGAKRVC